MSSPQPRESLSFWQSPAIALPRRSVWAGYLRFLGIRMILDSRRDEGVSVAGLPRRRNPFRQGVKTEVLHPKPVRFFLSFIPQFVDRVNGHVFLQFELLGTLSGMLNASVNIVATLLAGPLGPRIRASVRFCPRQPALTGAAMIRLGNLSGLRRVERRMGDCRALIAAATECRRKNRCDLG
jgi:threonine/homoserine/homoserine lactone efflux protein